MFAFAVPFDEIAPVPGRSAATTRQLASRARRLVQGAEPAPDTDRTHLRTVVDAFRACARPCSAAGSFRRPPRVLPR